MKIDLSEREWRHIKIGLLQSISNVDKCSKCEFKDNPLIKQLLKLHDKIDKECDRTK
jgi:hypothetical protein